MWVTFSVYQIILKCLVGLALTSETEPLLKSEQSFAGVLDSLVFFEMHPINLQQVQTPTCTNHKRNNVLILTEVSNLS